MNQCFSRDKRAIRIDQGFFQCRQYAIKKRGSPNRQMRSVFFIRICFFVCWRENRKFFFRSSNKSLEKVLKIRETWTNDRSMRFTNFYRNRIGLPVVKRKESSPRDFQFEFDARQKTQLIGSIFVKSCCSLFEWTIYHVEESAINELSLFSTLEVKLYDLYTTRAIAFGVNAALRIIELPNESSCIHNL